MSRKVAHEIISLYDNYSKEEFIERAVREWAYTEAMAELCWNLINEERELCSMSDGEEYHG